MVLNSMCSRMYLCPSGALASLLPPILPSGVEPMAPPPISLCCNHRGVSTCLTFLVQLLSVQSEFRVESTPSSDLSIY